MITRGRIFTPDTANSKPRLESAPYRSLKANYQAGFGSGQGKAIMHREELLEDWRFCRQNAVPAKIEPLA
jgi:hypothetical protein